MMLPHHKINVLVLGPHRFTFWSSIGTYHSGFMLKNLMMFTGFSCKSYAEQLLSELSVVISYVMSKFPVQKESMYFTLRECCLLSYFSLAGMATEHSEKCCETLADAGAVEILLKQIHSLNRGVPDQEVLKHVLRTLRNIARFPKLLQVLISAPRSVEIIFQELLRFSINGVSFSILNNSYSPHYPSF